MAGGGRCRREGQGSGPLRNTGRAGDGAAAGTAAGGADPRVRGRRSGLPVYFLPPEARTGKGAGRGRGCVLGTSSAGSLPAEPDEQERGCLDGDCGGSWLLLGVVIILGWVLTKTGG